MSEPTTAQASLFDSFLTPEAMLTPGVAGAMTMMITNALWQNFALPPAYTGLALSFVFGLLVLAAAKALIPKAVFYVLNSLVIFCVAAGASGFASAPATRPVEHAELTSYTVADARPNDACTAKVEAAQKAGASSQEIVKIVAACQQASQTPPQTPAQKSRPFFTPWKF
jgi:hypothetical protein